MKKNSLLRLLSIVACLLLLVSCGQNKSNEESSTATSGGEASKTSEEAPATNVDWPTGTVELICGMSPGGDSDFNTRVMAKYLSEKLGQPFVVTNIKGAGGSIATDDFVTNSKPDGSRFYMNHCSLYTAKAFGLTDYGVDDMEPVCIIGLGTGEFVTINADNPAETIQDLIEQTKQNPGKLRFGFNPGATSNYLSVVLEKEGAKFNNVASGSASDRVVALKGGHLDVIVAGWPNVKDYVEQGDFKVLGSCASERYQTVKDFPTLKEQGLDASFDPYYVIYAPKGTDKAIIEKMSKACGEIINNNKDYQKEIMDSYMQVPIYYDTEEATKITKEGEDKFMKISDELKKSFEQQSK